MKKSNRNMLIVFLIFLLLVFLGYISSKGGFGGVTGHVIDVQNPEEGDSSPIQPNDKILLNGSSGSDGGDDGDDTGGDEDTDYWFPPADPEPQDEMPEKCKSDGECSDGEICYERNCAEVECAKDSDCKDNDPCTPDKCYYAGHPNAYCAEPMTEKIPHDGCCPPGAWVDTDIDCPPVCGNHKCELGEGWASCEEDCPNTGGGDSSSGGNDGPVYE